MNEDAEKLDNEKAELFQIYLSKRARPDFQPVVSHRTTSVTQPNIDDWNKLGRAIKYLRATKDLLWLTLLGGKMAGGLMHRSPSILI